LEFSKFAAKTETEIRKHALFSDGNQQGESLQNENKHMSPYNVSNWILKGIIKNKRNKILPWEGRLTELLKRIIPYDFGRLYYNAFFERKTHQLSRFGPSKKILVNC
jgi:short-subunit dehydrogenase